MDLELREFAYVVAVAEERQFTRAAERLHVAQPALSRAVRRVEQRLGVRLFDRTSRRVDLTPAGEAFVTAARVVLDAADLAVADARRAGGAGGVLRVHVIEPSLETSRVLLRALRAEHPDLVVHQTTLPWADVAAALREGRIDASIGGVDHADDHIGTLRIRDERIGVLLPEGHPLVERDEVPVAELAHERLVRMDQELSPTWNALVTGLCRRAGFEPRWYPSTTYGVATGADLVAEGECVLVCLSSIATQHLPGVVHRYLSPDRRARWTLAWRVDEPLAPAVASLVAIAGTTAREQGWLLAPDA